MCKDVTISEIKEAQRICLERGIPFFAYRLPDSGNFCFGAQISGEVAGNCSPSVFLEDSGFLFSPFHVANNSPVRFLRNDIDLSKAGDLDILKVTPKKNVPDTVPVGEIGKGIYIKQAERVISALRSGKIRKAVLSRVRQFFCDPYKKAPEWFDGDLSRCFCLFGFDSRRDSMDGGYPGNFSTLFCFLYSNYVVGRNKEKRRFF